MRTEAYPRLCFFAETALKGDGGWASGAGRRRRAGERPVSVPGQVNRSDGKPCSGVRGGQQASTEGREPSIFRLILARGSCRFSLPFFLKEFYR